MLPARQVAAAEPHYLFPANFCNVASDLEKGAIEQNVQDKRSERPAEGATDRVHLMECRLARACLGCPVEGEIPLCVQHSRRVVNSLVLGLRWCGTPS